jgi:thiol-disulfide isomerase/thioredoxin
MAVPRMGLALACFVANALCFCAWATASQQLPLDLAGRAVDPFAAGSELTVLVFVRTDCPLSNRYAPEIQHLARRYASHGVNFWLVYPDNAETPAGIQKHLAAYGYTLPALRDAHHFLVRMAEATVTPEAAVFRGSKLLYHGRIDNRVQDFGQTRVVVTAHDLEDAIAAALDNKPIPPAVQAVGCYISDLR